MQGNFKIPVFTRPPFKLILSAGLAVSVATTTLSAANVQISNPRLGGDEVLACTTYDNSGSCPNSQKIALANIFCKSLGHLGLSNDNYPGKKTPYTTRHSSIVRVAQSKGARVLDKVMCKGGEPKYTTYNSPKIEGYWIDVCVDGHGWGGNRCNTVAQQTIANYYCKVVRNKPGAYLVGSSYFTKVNHYGLGRKILNVAYSDRNKVNAAGAVNQQVPTGRHIQSIYCQK